MLRADELLVTHHDDTVSRFTDVRYMLGRGGLRVLTAAGAEVVFACHDVLTTQARTAVAPGRRGEHAVVAA